MSRTKGKRFADKHTAREIKQDKRSIITNEEYNNYNSSRAIKNEKPRRKKKNSIIYNFIIVICTIAIIFSSINIVLWFIDNQKNKKLAEDLLKDIIVTEEDVIIDNRPYKKKHYDISKLIEKNSDTVGWLNMENTNIDYPVVKYSDNDFYLNHSFDKSTNSAGWVFADHRCTFPNLGRNTVIYGHNRKDASMFGTLQRTLQEEWYENEENLYINFSTQSGDHVYKIFSTFVCNDADVDGYTQTVFADNDEFKEYVNKLKKRSSHDFNTNISDPQQIITLYTCYGLNNQRLLVCAVLVD